MNDIQKKVEAILFAIGDPISIKKLAEIISVKEEEIKSIITLLGLKYQDETSGICLIEHSDSVQLATKPELFPILEKLVIREARESLTPATLETLSLITYLAPISKSSLEYIRGVNSSFTLRNLLIRGLIERIPHPKKTNTYLYRPTSDLIRHLGISKLEDLIDFNKYQELKNELENEQ